MPDKQHLLTLYRRMQTIRRCEEHLARAHQRGLIHGACHTYVGEEAIATGVCATSAKRMWSSAHIEVMATRWPRGSPLSHWSPSCSVARPVVHAGGVGACTCSRPRSA